MHLLDAVVWVQSDMAEAERRGIERDGGYQAAVSFWHLWMAEELPFMARQRPWTRANVIVAGTPRVPHDPANEVVIAQADNRSPAPYLSVLTRRRPIPASDLLPSAATRARIQLPGQQPAAAGSSAATATAHRRPSRR